MVADRITGLLEELRLVIRERDLLSLRASSLAGELARESAGEAIADVSTADWIRHELNLGYQAACDLVRVGLEMDSLEDTVSAVAEHEIGFQHLVFMARTKHQVGAKPFPEEHLLAEAKEVSVGSFWHLCQQARHADDAAGMARAQGWAVEGRALR